MSILVSFGVWKSQETCSRLSMEEHYALRKYRPKFASKITEDEIKKYIISLKERKERRSHIASHFHSLSYDYEFFDAIIPNNEQLHLQTLPKGKLGCSLSHRALWLKVLKSGMPALIMEDDIYITDEQFKNSISSALNSIEKWDIVFLGHCFENKGTHEFENFYKSVKPRCRHAYLLSPSGAYTLLTKTNTCSFGDEQLGSLINKNGITSLSLHPPAVNQSWQVKYAKQFESDLSNGDGTFK